MVNNPRYNPEIHHRRSIRLKGFDYSRSGLYFITICCQNRAHLFGKVKNKEMILNDAGKMVKTEWLKLPERFKNIKLHEYIVMPNHFHAILEIVSVSSTTIGATLVVAPNDTVVQNDTVAQNDTDDTNDTVIQNIIDIIDCIDTINNIDTIDLIDWGQPQGVAPTGPPKSKNIGDMVGAFKSIVTVEYICGVKTMGWAPFNGKLWQRDYYEHIIRDEQSYFRISNYIINNPAKWTGD